MPRLIVNETWVKYPAAPHGAALVVALHATSATIEWTVYSRHGSARRVSHQRTRLRLDEITVVPSPYRVSAE